MKDSSQNTRVGVDNDQRIAAMSDQEICDIHSRVCYRLGRRYCDLNEKTNEAEKQAVAALELYEKALDKEIERRSETNDPVRKLYQPGSQEQWVKRGIYGATGRDLFAPTGDPWNGNFDDFFRAILTGKSDPRLFEARTSSNLSGASGGFLSPDALSVTVYDSSRESSEILRRIYAMSIETKSVDQVAFNSEDHSGGLYAGYRASWVPELGSITDTDCILRNIHIETSKLIISSGMSLELYADAPKLSAEIVKLLGRALRTELELAIYRGDGLGGPLGMLASPSRIAVSRAVANQISYVDLANMAIRVAPQFRQNAIFVVSPEALQQLYLLQDVTGHYIWTSGTQNVAGGQPPTLLGFPVYVTEAAGALGDEGDIALVDFSQYLFVTRQELYYEMSNSVYWSTAAQAFRMWGRFGGATLLNVAITPRFGSSTLSWAVTLG